MIHHVGEEDFLVYVSLDKEEGTVHDGEGPPGEGGLQAPGHAGVIVLRPFRDAGQLWHFLKEENAAEVFGGQLAEVFLLLPHLEIRHGFPGFEGLEEIPGDDGVKDFVEKVLEGGDAGGGQSAPMMALPGVPTVLPVAVDSLGMNIPTNFPPVTNLCFWGVERGSNAVSLGIGHACGWADIYASRNNCTPSILYESPQVSWMPHDWNNGTGCRFYSQLKSQSDIILRLLMHGVNAGGQSDIPSGGVFGLGNDGGTGLMNIGRYGMTTVSPHSN